MTVVLKDDTPVYYEKQEGKVIIMPYSEEVISRIKEKIKTYSGLLREELEIAANMGLIERHQFANWTLEKQRQWEEMEEEYKRGEYHGSFEGIEEAKKILKKPELDKN